MPESKRDREKRKSTGVCSHPATFKFAEFQLEHGTWRTYTHHTAQLTWVRQDCTGFLAYIDVTISSEGRDGFCTLDLNGLSGLSAQSGNLP